MIKIIFLDLTKPDCPTQEINVQDKEHAREVITRLEANPQNRVIQALSISHNPTIRVFYFTDPEDYPTD